MKANEKRKRNPYICICGFETHYTSEWRGHLFVYAQRDGKGTHYGVDKQSEKQEPVAVAVAETADDITDDELFELTASGQHLSKPDIRTCIIIRPNHKGGVVKEKMDVNGYDLSKCIWREYGVEYPVFVDSSNGHQMRLTPFESLDEIGESPYHLFEAANPVDYRELCKYQPGNLEKIRLGLMILLVFGTFLLIYIMSKGGP